MINGLWGLLLNTFLQPLSPKEERHYLLILRYGEDGQKKLARETLIERNMRLVAHIARKYQNAGEDMEDLISTGTIGLIKAINSFDITKGKLSTYASRCIENEILMLLRYKRKSARDVSIYEPIGTDKEGNEIQLLDITTQEQEDIVERLERENKLDKLPELVLKVLNKREQEIICMRYGLWGKEEMTQRVIGDKLGISRSYVSRIEKRALEKLREGLE